MGEVPSLDTQRAVERLRKIMKILLVVTEIGSRLYEVIFVLHTKCWKMGQRLSYDKVQDITDEGKVSLWIA